MFQPLLFGQKGTEFLLQLWSLRYGDNAVSCRRQPYLCSSRYCLGTEITLYRVGGNLTYVPAVTVWVEGYRVPVTAVEVQR